MKLDDLKQSNRVEDHHGQSGSSYGGGSSGGNGMGGLLLQLLFSRGKGKWIIIAILLLSFFVGGGQLGDLIDLNSYQSSYEKNYTPSTVSDEDAVFISKVFASTEEFWTQEFEKEGLTYHPPTLVIYDQATETGGCGVGSASAGPFYCPADKKVYIDLSFYQELSTKYQAAGDFAMAYVIAHEVGHHVQNELGTMDTYNQKQPTPPMSAWNCRPTITLVPGPTIWKDKAC